MFGTGATSSGVRITHLHSAAIAVAFVSGSYALIALAVGSPIAFGIPLALCGASWVAAHFLEWTVEHGRGGRSRETLSLPGGRRESARPQHIPGNAVLWR